MYNPETPRRPFLCRRLCPAHYGGSLPTQGSLIPLRTNFHYENCVAALFTVFLCGVRIVGERQGQASTYWNMAAYLMRKVHLVCTMPLLHLKEAESRRRQGAPLPAMFQANSAFVFKYTMRAIAISAVRLSHSSSGSSEIAWGNSLPFLPIPLRNGVEEQKPHNRVLLQNISHHTGLRPCQDVPVSALDTATKQCSAPLGDTQRVGQRKAAIVFVWST